MFFSYIKLIFIIYMNELIENSQLLSFPLFCVFIYFFILFFQSSVDKILNWSSELEWIKSHFGKSIFKSNVPLLLFTLTLLELATAILCLLSIFNFFIQIYDPLPFFALFFNSCTLICLFLGQRVAKDYQGAVSISVYFIINLIGLILLSI